MTGAPGLEPKDFPLGKSEPLSCEVVQVQIKFLQGKVLTIIEAAIPDREQKKAVKDLIKGAFSDQLTYVLQLCYPEVRMMTHDEAHSTIEDVDAIETSAETLKVKA